MTPETASAATALLVREHAPPRLLRHNELVLEAAELLLSGFRRMGCWSGADGSPRETPFLNEELVRIGVVFHDAGKAVFREELDGPGDLHERHGAELLLKLGASPECTTFCDMMARFYAGDELTLEEYVVALADKLWRGARDQELEEQATREIVYAATGEYKRFVDWWCALDTLFASIAAGGHERLERSRI